jgi:hypothetical protein
VAMRCTGAVGARKFLEPRSSGGWLIATAHFPSIELIRAIEGLSSARSPLRTGLSPGNLVLRESEGQSHNSKVFGICVSSFGDLAVLGSPVPLARYGKEAVSTKGRSVELRPLDAAIE